MRTTSTSSFPKTPKPKNRQNAFFPIFPSFPKVASFPSIPSETSKTSKTSETPTDNCRDRACPVCHPNSQISTTTQCSVKSQSKSRSSERYAVPKALRLSPISPFSHLSHASPPSPTTNAREPRSGKPHTATPNNRHQPALCASPFAREIKTSSLQPFVLLFLCLNNFCLSVKRESRSVASPLGCSRSYPKPMHPTFFHPHPTPVCFDLAT